MTREELLALRNALQAQVEARRRLGDYDTNAAGVRDALDACLKLAQHLLDRMRKS
jgi:hypothetical protein